MRLPQFPAVLPPQLIVLDDLTRIDELLNYITSHDLVAFDCETTGVHKGAEIIGMSFCASEHEAYYVITAAWDPDSKTLVYLDTVQRAKELAEALRGKRLIGHNFNFDAQRVSENYKVDLIEYLHTDTMALAHLLNENRRIGLKELGKEYFGDTAAAEAAEMKASVAANGGTLTKANYELYKADCYLMAKYGAKDALLTYQLFLALLPELYDQGLDKFFYEDETMPLLKGPTYELNTVGLNVDLKAMVSLQKQLEAECAEAKSFIFQEIMPHIQERYPCTNKKSTFNIGASQQLSWLLFGVLGLEFGTLTKGGKTLAKDLGLKCYSAAEKRRFIAEITARKDEPLGPKKKIRDPWAYIACDKETLKKLAPRHKFIDRLLEYQRKMKLLNTYVEGIQERTKYGVINPSFIQTGTTSGRYSSRNPNFQNLPRDDKRIKSCIVARPGRVFVGADHSQLEPRVFAYFSGDEALRAAFAGNADDFYSVIGARVYNKTDCTLKKEGSDDAFGVKYKKLRDLSKVIALASTYGATARQLMKTTGKDEQDTQEDMDAYFHAFPGVAQMMLQSHAEAKANGQVVNFFGRPRRIPEAKTIDKIYGKKDHADLPYEARGLLNLAVNHKIQSTGASIVNRGMIKLYNYLKEAGISAKMVCQVHDSLIVECDEADGPAVAALMQDALETAVSLPGITFECIPKIGTNFGEV